jgi:drug/metabolite transporter (DMT)-like permease
VVAAVLGLGGALLFGASDFVGGIASRMTSPLKVTAFSALTGLVLLSVATALFGGTWSTDAVVIGALSGVAVGGALALLYTSLAIGPMSVLSPLTGLISAVVPMTAGLLTGDRLDMFGYLALALALFAVLLLGLSPEKSVQRPSAKGLSCAVGAGLLFGAFLILLDLTPPDSGLIPLAFSRAANACVMGLAILVMVVLARNRQAPALPGPDAVPQGMRFLADQEGVPSWRVGLKLAIACGLIDSLANTLQLFGLRFGELSVMSVLNAMYPAGTIILAAILLRERITRMQSIGLALALIAAVLFAV